MPDTVGSKVFSAIEADERVTPELKVCLYCRTTWHGKDGRHKDTDYEVPLTGTDKIKQCPACKTIYILNDPTEP